MSKGQAKIETFAVLNTQTTGLLTPERDVAMTEICIHGISAESVRNRDNTPRIVHKLVMAFKPKLPIQPKAEGLSRLNVTLLDGESYFDSNAAGAIMAFLNHLKKPVCLVAHNGDDFGFPILKRAFRDVAMELHGDMKSIDSLKVIRAIDGLSDVPRSLNAVYVRCFAEDPRNPHQAEGKVVSLRSIMCNYGPLFTEFADMNAEAF